MPLICHDCPAMPAEAHAVFRPCIVFTWAFRHALSPDGGKGLARAVVRDIRVPLKTRGGKKQVPPKNRFFWEFRELL